MELPGERVTAETKDLLGDRVFRQLGRAIIDGTLREGERVRDAEIAQRLNVSRMPVREALQRLERIGLVEILPSRHTRVTAITPEMVRTSLEYAGYQAGTVAHMTVPILTAEQRAQAVELIDRMIASVDDTARNSFDRRLLYSFLSRHSRNALHHAHMKEMELALERNLRHFAESSLARTILRRNYLDLREAVLTGDADAAERLIREQHGILSKKVPPRRSGPPGVS